MLIIEAVVNRYLELDPEMLTRLARFDGKVIKLEMTGVNRDFYLLPNQGGMQMLAEYDGSVDTVLRGSPVSLFKMGLVSNVADLLLKGEIEISGDTRLGHQFKNVFSEIDIDWSEPLANVLGDGLAYQVQQSASKFSHWGKQSLKSVSTSCSEYLQEESRDVVTDTELDIFNAEVDRLRNDVDRLQARINALIESRKT